MTFCLLKNLLKLYHIHTTMSIFWPRFLLHFLLHQIRQRGFADVFFEGFYEIGAAIEAAFEAGFGDVTSVIEEAFGVAYFAKLDIFFNSDIGVVFKY